jgi:5-methylcytosine-specific restriction enzyme A
MATYLFAWNPVYWDWPELPNEIRRLKRRGHVDIGWASGRTRAIEPGTRAFMVRLGVPPKGIIGSGFTLTTPTPGRHWIDSKVRAGVPALHLKLRLETLSTTPIVTFDDLARQPFSRFRWGVRASGTRVPSTLAEALEDLWEKRVATVRAKTVTAAPRPAKVKGGRAG